MSDTSFTEIPAFASYTEAEKAEIIRWARELAAIGRGPALGGIPSSKESLSAARGISTENLVHISCPQLNTVIRDWMERDRKSHRDYMAKTIVSPTMFCVRHLRCQNFHPRCPVSGTSVAGVSARGVLCA